MDFDDFVTGLLKQKEQLITTLAKNIDISKLEFTDVPLGCRVCARSSTQLYHWQFNTLSGDLHIQVCQFCFELIVKRSKQLSKEEIQS
jgi:hypothetical protein